MVKNFVKQKLFLWFGLVYKISFWAQLGLGVGPNPDYRPGSREGGNFITNVALRGWFRIETL